MHTLREEWTMPRYRVLTAAASNPKTAKLAELKQVLSAVLHLAPGDLSGYEVCPWRSGGCTMACLNTAGRGGLFKAGETTNTIQEARKRRTRRFFEEREAFLADIVADITKLVKEAAKLGWAPAIRLNGTSDLEWETVPVTVGGVDYENLMVAFPTVTFYDYTKVGTRLGRSLPNNYVLTFSLSESNDKYAIRALDAGLNVAVVLDYGKALPSTWAGRPVIDGDEHDFRFLDRRGGYIVALKAKGKAKRDTSGFVRRMDGTLDAGKRVTFALKRTAPNTAERLGCAA